MSQQRVCVIGAGASGMSVLYQLNRLKKEGKDVPDVVCFEKQESIGGLWKYTWRTGVDEYGEPVHGSMYRYLWTNAAKEVGEFPDYTFQDHFGKAIASFSPREVLFDYLKGRWQKEDLTPSIRLNHIVQDVQYNEKADNFTVVVKHLVEDKVLAAETFDYVIVATGHFSTPNVPYFPGVEGFPGRVLHAHDFRDAEEFKGKRVLVVGANYSGQDIVTQVIKYGAQSAVLSWRTHPTGFKLPPQTTERPLLQKVEGHTCHFKDGSTAEFDAIILCTGYQHVFKFLADDLRLRSDNVAYPSHMYKGIVYLKGGNNRCLYIGMQNQAYSFTMFDAQARWAVKYIVGDITLPDKATILQDVDKWVTRNNALPLDNVREFIEFQTDYVQELVKDADYGYNLDVSHIMHQWQDNREEDYPTYRDKSFVSIHTGIQSPLHHTAFMDAMDDSMETFLSAKN